MYRRIWLLAGAIAAVLAVAGSATATSKSASVAPDVTPAAAPFASVYSQLGRTPAARKAKSQVVVAMEQDLSGTWNTNEASSTLAWANWAGLNGTLRGPYVLTDKYQYKYDLVTKVTVTKKSISYNIRNDANWNYGGKKLPVTYKDFVYTWKSITNAKDNAASRATGRRSP